MEEPQDDYNWANAGFDGFMSRAIDTWNMARLDQLPFNPYITPRFLQQDQTQVTGKLGDKQVLGNIIIDGVKGRISVFDSDNNEVVQLGKIDG